MDTWGVWREAKQKLSSFGLKSADFNSLSALLQGMESSDTYNWLVNQLNKYKVAKQVIFHIFSVFWEAVYSNQG